MAPAHCEKPRPTRRRARVFFAAVVGLALAWASPPGRAGANEPSLTWYGQSCFLLETANGTRIVMDPLSGAVGFPLPADLHADVVTVSHEHADHNNLGLVQGKTLVYRGLTPDEKGWVKIDARYSDVTIRSVGVYHDERRGRQRGLNTIFVFETGGIRIAHLGDLGHTLGDRELSQLGSVDVALVPVGGHYTIDASQAARVIEQIRPRLIVIPMHYRTEVSHIKELATVETFAAGQPHVRRLSGNTIDIKTIKKRPGAEVVILNYK